MMKNIKRLTLVAMFVASIALVMTSCAMKLNTEQKRLYEGIIHEIEYYVAKTQLSAVEIEEGIEEINEDLKKQQAGFKIVDTQAGKPVAKGTTATALRKRFVPKKA